MSKPDLYLAQVSGSPMLILFIYILDLASGQLQDAGTLHLGFFEVRGSLLPDRSPYNAGRPKKECQVILFGMTIA